jgi:membrane fusion protein, heavy metal efflux system
MRKPEIKPIAWLTVALILGLSGCSAPSGGKSAPVAAAKVENAVKESDLAAVVLTEESEKRLKIEVAQIEVKDVSVPFETSGEAMIPTGLTMTVTAPMAGTLQAGETLPAVGQTVKKGQPVFRLSPLLSPERDLRNQLQRDVTSLEERLAAAKLRKDRAEKLAAERAGSERDAERTREEFAVLENELKTARERLERFDRAPLASGVTVAIPAPIGGTVLRVLASSDQPVSGGAALLDIADTSTMWIRTPVYTGDAARVSGKSPARINGLPGTGHGPTRIGRPVSAPPTADPAGGTVDFYFSVSNEDGALRPGQRVAVTLAGRTSETAPTAPASAIVYDATGGAWVYENAAPHRFVRRAVRVRRVVGDLAVIERGPGVGTKVVTVGVAELFGAEFGAGK